MKFLPNLLSINLSSKDFSAIFKGIGVTFLIALGGILIGLIIGILIAIVKISNKDKWYKKILNIICNVYVAIFRGTPITVQLLIFCYVIFATLRGSEIYVAIIVFGLNSGAYLSESIRAGINAVDKGQMEASRSLGLNFKQSMVKIILPQAIKNILPAIGNEFIALIKETSVVGFISVSDITKVFQNIGLSYLDVYLSYIPPAIIYFVIVGCFVLLLGLLEKRLKKSDRN